MWRLDVAAHADDWLVCGGVGVSGAWVWCLGVAACAEDGCGKSGGLGGVRGVGTADVWAWWGDMCV